MIVTADGREFVRAGDEDGGVVADVELFKIGEDCIYQTDVDAVMPVKILSRQTRSLSKNPFYKIIGLSHEVAIWGRQHFRE